MKTGGSAAYVFGVRSVGQEPLRRALGERHRQSSCVSMAAKLGVHGRVPELRVHLGVLFRTTHLRQHLPSLASYPSLLPSTTDNPKNLQLKGGAQPAGRWQPCSSSNQSTNKSLLQQHCRSATHKLVPPATVTANSNTRGKLAVAFMTSKNLWHITVCIASGWIR
jgi:hypothetical protein